MMTRFLILVLIGTLLMSCTSGGGGLSIVKNGSPVYKILLAPGADSLTQKAASELKHYVREISGGELEITTKLDSPGKFIKIGSQAIVDPLLTNQLSGLKRDGFIIKTSGHDLWLAGMNSRGTLYAVYTLLEEYLGCMKFAYGEEFISKPENITLPEIDKVYDPSFSYRHIYLHDKADTQLIDWYRIENLDEWGMYVHTFQKLVAPEVYFDEHPDYFSWVNGRRIKDGQLCLSNPEVIQLLKDNLRKEIAKKPGFEYWSVSQNDCINYCECAPCNKLYEKYGNYSGAYIEMANSIAAEFPDKQISTLAYQFTRAAPKNIKPLGNVNIMFCSIECNRSMALVDDPRSAGFVQEMKDWSALTHNIYMWDYVVQFENYLCPFPNFNTLQANIRFFNKHSVDMIFEQGSNVSWSDMKDLKLYLLSKLAWDVNANVDSLTNRFFEIYYREASGPIRKYFDLVHQRLHEKQEGQFLNIYGFPVDYANSFLKPEHLVEYKALMDSAEVLAQNDPALLTRVWRARMAVDFAYLDLALNFNSSLLTYFIEANGQSQLNPEMLAYLNRMVAMGEECDITKVNEKNLTLSDYREYVLRNLSWKSKQNKAKSAHITILGKYSEKYQVGGGAALTDGLMGGLNFTFNWLGFEGEDMEVVIDFGQKTEIEKISMNFLKALVSWVFLPKEIKLESSPDGIYYTLLEKVNPDVEDRNFRVESVPFVFDVPGTKTRYLRITAQSLKTCPDWHRGFGEPCWIFVDEIVVE